MDLRIASKIQSESSYYFIFGFFPRDITSQVYEKTVSVRS